MWVRIPPGAPTGDTGPRQAARQPAAGHLATNLTSVTGHMTPEEFREYGRQVVDWIADYHERIESFPVLSQVAPGEVRAALPPHPPEAGEPFAALLRDLDDVLLPGITHWQHPSFFGYFPANASGPAI